MQHKNLNFFYKIDKIYPDGYVNGLKERAPRVYEEAKLLARDEDLTLKDFFLQNGYIFSRNTKKKIHSKDKEDLLLLYPNGKVKDLYKKDVKLYYRILHHARSEFMNIKDYLKKLGFEYVLFKDDTIEKEISERLKELYPNKKVLKLAATDPKLYSKIYKVAKKKDMNIYKYIKKLGYKVIE